MFGSSKRTMKWSSLLKDFREKVGFSNQSPSQVSSPTSASGGGDGSDHAPPPSATTSAIDAGESRARDRHELELDFKRFWEEFRSSISEKDEISPGSNLLYAIEVLLSEPIDKQPLLDSGILCCLIHVLNSLLSTDEANQRQVASPEELPSFVEDHNEDSFQVRRLEIRVLLMAVKDFNHETGDSAFTMGIVDLLLECVELSYRPEAGSIRLREDIHNAHGYQFLVQFALTLSALDKSKVCSDGSSVVEQNDSAGRGDLSPSRISPALSRLLDVLVTLAQTGPTEFAGSVSHKISKSSFGKASGHSRSRTPSSDRIIDEIWDKGNAKVKDLEAIQMLQDIFLKADNTELQAEVLSRMFKIYSSHLENYTLCQQLRTVPLFILNMAEFPPSLQEIILKILEYAVTVVNCVPEQELLSLCCLLQQPITSGLKHTILSFFVKLLSFDQQYKKVLREVGVLEVQLDVLNFIKKLAQAGPFNQENLTSIGCVGLLLETIHPFLVGSSPLLIHALRIVEVLGAYRLSSSELRMLVRYIMQMKQVNSGHLLVDMMERLIQKEDMSSENVALAPFVEMDMSKTGHASVQDNGVLTLATSSSCSLSFSGLELEEERWHHLVVVHSKPNALAGLFQASVAYIYLNGKLKHTGKLGYSPSPIGKALQVTIGTPVTSAKITDLSWRLRCCYLFEEVLTPGSVCFMYILGRGYRGLFQDTDLLQFVPYQACGGGSMAILDSLDSELPLAPNVQRIDSSGRQSKVDGSGIVWDFERLTNLSLQLSGKKLIFAFDGTSSEASRPSGISSMLNLVDTMSAVASPIGGIPRFGRLNGDIYICSQCVIGESIRTVGGMAVILSLVEASETRDMLHMSLSMLACALHQSSQNVHDMQACRGYHLLSLFLHRRMALFDMQSLDILFQIAACEASFSEPQKLRGNQPMASPTGTVHEASNEDMNLPIYADELASIGSHGDLDFFSVPKDTLGHISELENADLRDETSNCIVLSNADMVEHVLLDWTLWVTAPVSIQISLLAFLERLVSMHWYRNHNLTVLRRINLVQHLLVTLQRGDVEVAVLEKLVVLLGVILEDGFLASELELVVRFVIMTYDPPEVEVRNQILRELMGKHVIVRNMLLEMLIDLQMTINSEELLEQWHKIVSSKLITYFLDEAVHPTSMRWIMTLLGVCLASSPTFSLKFRNSGGYQGLTRVLPSFYDSPDIYYILFCLTFGKAVYPRLPEVRMLDFFTLMQNDGCYGELKFVELLESVIAMAKCTFDRLSMQSLLAHQNGDLSNLNGVLAAELEVTDDMEGELQGEALMHKTHARLMGGEAAAPMTATKILRFMVHLAKMCPPFSAVCRRTEFLESCVDLYFSCVRSAFAVKMAKDLSFGTQDDKNLDDTDDIKSTQMTLSSVSHEQEQSAMTSVTDGSFPQGQKSTSSDDIIDSQSCLLDTNIEKGASLSFLDSTKLLMGEDSPVGHSVGDETLGQTPLVSSSVSESNFHRTNGISDSGHHIDSLSAVSSVLPDSPVSSERSNFRLGLTPSSSPVIALTSWLGSTGNSEAKAHLNATPSIRSSTSMNDFDASQELRANSQGSSTTNTFFAINPTFLFEIDDSGSAGGPCSSGTNAILDFIAEVLADTVAEQLKASQVIESILEAVPLYVDADSVLVFQGMCLSRLMTFLERRLLRDDEESEKNLTRVSEIPWVRIKAMEGRRKREMGRKSRDTSKLDLKHWDQMNERRYALELVRDAMATELRVLRQDKYGWVLHAESEWQTHIQQLVHERGIFPICNSSIAEPEWQLCPIEGPYRMRKKLERCKLKIDAIQNVLTTGFAFEDALVSKEKDIHGLGASETDSDSFFNTLSDGDKQNLFDEIEYEESFSKQEDDFKNDDALHHRLGGMMIITESINAISDMGSPRQSSSMKIDDIKSAEGKPEKELHDNGEYLIRPYLEPFEKIRFRYNCERVVGLDKHDGIFLIGDLCLYVIENFYVDESGCICEKECEDDLSVIDQALGVKKDVNGSSEFQPKSPSSWGMTAKACIGGRAWAYNGGAWGKEKLRPVAIEIFSMDGCNDLLVFHKKEREEVFRNMVALNLPRNSMLDTTISGSSKQEGNEGSRLFKIMAKSFSKRWQNGEISNFQYLMHLNTLAGRGYSDLTQYPVFPWVLADYESEVLDFSNPQTFRKLDKPMGCQTPVGEEEFKKRYESWDDPDVPKFHYGSHYSSAGIVLFYLLRLPPFSTENQKLQGGQFDHADRLFNSIRDTWFSAAGRGNTSDVKELIPEFFYMPEFLENLFHLDLGEKQSGEKAAEEAVNVFYHYTYEGNVDIDSVSDPAMKASILAQINHFGQTPKQLFLKPHVKRRPDRRIPIHPLRHSNHLIPQEIRRTSSISHIITLNDKILFAGSNSFLKPVTYSKYISWGFPDRSLRFMSYDQDKLLSTHENLHGGSQIQCAGISHDGHILVTGGDDGVISVWRISKDGAKARTQRRLNLERSLCAHTSKITCLHVSQPYMLIVTGSDDHTVILWDLSSLIFVKQLPEFPSPISAIYVNDLTGEIATAAGVLLAVWSVNGDCLAVVNTSQLPSDSILSVTGTSFSDWLETCWYVTGHQSGAVKVWKMIHGSDDSGEQTKSSGAYGTSSLGLSGKALPEYRLVLHRVLKHHKHPVTALHLTSDLKQLLSGDSGGHLVSWNLPEEILRGKLNQG
ncbi:hypothetical protein QJS10_CPB18g01229 [Acorus calamus]|uniref:Uncharacterized protein n=1 Tax=Acorus calamus TaxID=4465 RepID=A0AAV9CL50_ACOCL|nr:hypothetical protein QJS10_CPB18g01229 [Acorus calamus]